MRSLPLPRLSQRQQPTQCPSPPCRIELQVQPPPPPLHPVQMQLAGRKSGAGGPFIFDPYAARRRAAAASDAEAQPVWVAKDECRVEVLLHNPLMVPLKLEALSLWVAFEEAPPAPPLLRAPSAAGGAAGAPAAGAAAAPGAPGSPTKTAAAPPPPAAAASPFRPASAGSAPALSCAASSALSRASSSLSPADSLGYEGLPEACCHAAPIALTLPPQGKPLKVLLAVTPLRPGQLRVLGVRAAMAGVQWCQTFTEAPRRAAAAASGSGPCGEGDAGRPAGGGGPAGKRAGGAAAAFAVKPRSEEGAASCRVAVLPPMPVLKANLSGPDLNMTYPQVQDLRVSAGPPAASDGLRAATQVAAFEGQVLSWQLQLTNISARPIAACDLSIVNQKGQPLKAAGGGGCLPAGYVGAHLEALSEALAAALPLGPQQTVSVPLRVRVGRKPHAFDETLELRVTYAGGDGSGSSEAAAAAGSAGTAGSDGALVGRQLTIPLKFQIQPTLQVKNVTRHRATL